MERAPPESNYRNNQVNDIISVDYKFKILVLFYSFIKHTAKFAKYTVKGIFLKND